MTTHYNHYSRSVDSNQYYHQPNQHSQHRPEVRTLKQSDFTPMSRPQETATSATSAAAGAATTMTSKYISTTLPSQSHSALNYCSTTTTSSSSSELLEVRCHSRYEYNDSKHFRSVVTSAAAATTCNQMNGNSNRTFQTMANMPKYENTYQYAATMGDNQRSSDTNPGDAALVVNGKCMQPAQSSTNGIQMNRGDAKSGPHDEYQSMPIEYELNGVSNGAVPEGRYGKILSHRTSEKHSIANGGNNYQSAHNHDRYNANVQYQQPSSPLPAPSSSAAAAARLSRTADNCANNNNTAVQMHLVRGGGSNNGYHCKSPMPAAMSNGVPMKTLNGSIGKSNGAIATVVVRPTPSLPAGHNKDGVNGNGLLRIAHQSHRYSNSHLTASGNHHPLAHLIGSLSSPESAYSTGYSTDGTSPGKRGLLVNIIE